MLTPTSFSETPPGGWRYTEASNGVVITSNHHRDFMQKVFAMLEANGLDTGSGWQSRVLDLVCRQNPQIQCKDIDKPDSGFTLEDIRRFSVSVGKWLDQGGQCVDQAESNRRAAICLTCPHNKVVAGCWGCHGVLDWITEKLGKRTDHDAHIHGCEVCKCALRAKVHMPLDAIDNTGVDGDFPEFCWQSTPPESSSAHPESQ